MRHIRQVQQWNIQHLEHAVLRARLFAVHRKLPGIQQPVRIRQLARRHRAAVDLIRLRPRLHHHAPRKQKRVAARIHHLPVRALQTHRPHHIIEPAHLRLQIDRPMAGLDDLVVRPTRRLQMARGRQLARLRVVLDMVRPHRPVAILQHHIVVQDVAVSNLRLRPRRSDLQQRRPLLLRNHPGLGISHRSGTIGQARPIGKARRRGCLSRHLLCRQLWMTCRNPRDSYQEVNSLQSAPGYAL